MPKNNPSILSKAKRAYAKMPTGRTISINNDTIGRLTVRNGGLQSMIDAARQEPARLAETNGEIRIALPDQFDTIAEIHHLPALTRALDICRGADAHLEIKKVPRTIWHDEADMLALVVTPARPFAELVKESLPAEGKKPRQRKQEKTPQL